MKKLISMMFSLLVLTSFSQQIVQAEYFFDMDPGYGNAQPINISSANEIEIDEYIDVSTLDPGFHSIHFRFQDENNQWSSVFSKGFYIEKNMGDPKLIDYVEYFYDVDPGYGNAIPFTEFTPSTYYEEIFFSNVTGLSTGTHEFFIRLRDELGSWSQTYSQNFELMNCELSISGQVLDPSNNPINAGFVVLYQYFGEGSAIGVDTLQLTNGNYQFMAVCPQSQYYLKAFPADEALFMPTYFGDSPYWEDAVIISTEQSNLTGRNIHLTQFVNMAEGTSQVKGHIYYAEFKGQPVKNVDVVLEYDDPTEKVGFQPVALDRSDEAGEWNIDGLPLGSFRIKVEIPGLGMDTTYYVDIVEAGSIIDHLDFYIDFNTGIFIDHTGIQEANTLGSLRLFPNPINKGCFYIQSSNEQLKVEQISIYQYSGQLIRNQNSNSSSISVNVNDLSKGFYLIRIQTNQGVMIEKIIIQ